MGSPVGVWFPLFLCIISYAVHVPTVSKGPRFPFQCGPRDTEHCLKYSNWDTQPHSPNKRRCKDKGIIGLNPEMNILLDIHNSVSISSQKMVRPWHKKHALSHELFLFSFFCLPIFAPPPFSDTQQLQINRALHPVVANLLNYEQNQSVDIICTCCVLYGRIRPIGQCSNVLLLFV